MVEHDLLRELLPYISKYGLWVVFFGMMLEGTTMIILSGVVCYMGMISIEQITPIAILGAVIGDQLWYFIGKYFSQKIFEKFSKLMQKSQKLKQTIINRGSLLAFGSRFVYGGAILFPFALGSYNYLYKKFTFFDTLGVTLWSILGIGLGYFLGNSIEYFFGKIDKIEHFILIIFVVITSACILKRYIFIPLKNR